MRRTASAAWALALALLAAAPLPAQGALLVAGHSGALAGDHRRKEYPTKELACEECANSGCSATGKCFAPRCTDCSVQQPAGGEDYQWFCAVGPGSPFPGTFAYDAC
mmetsp:Transcript_73530/g.215542  ORF Transcript_73530/g.215542 Transcript_73530/m.215542 type:complete len:107 (-) Transcript_73530:113-433(-)